MWYSNSVLLGKDVTKWSEKDGGYDFHLASTITEWIIAISLMGFLLTYADGFRKVAFDEPTVYVDNRRGSTKVFPRDSVENGTSRF